MVATANTLSAQPSRRFQALVWVLRLLMLAVFVPSGVMKLAGTSMAISEFQMIGLGDWFRYFTGLLELAGGLLALVPTLSAFGALLLLAVDIGAFVAQVSVLHMDWIHTIVIGGLLVTLTYLQRRQISARMADSGI